MCAICGIVNLDGRPADGALLTAMRDTMIHRGPDAAGNHLDGPVGLGHRRLSIIDLEGGGQPMGNETGTVWVVFNGEIYNFRELGKDLEARGATFRTKSDTEVILRAYEAYGPDCVSRLRGMFGFGVWDARVMPGRLLLARDRLGIKPLYYARLPQTFLFSSELKGILADPRFPRELDHGALGEYLSLNYIPATRTIFRAARKLPPGHRLTLSIGSGEATEEAYWRLPDEEDGAISEGEAIRETRRLLEAAVRRHLISDVPLGAFLSGGLDSSTLVALMARQTDQVVNTFSIGFEELSYDESPFAQRMADAVGARHHHQRLRARDVDALSRLARQYDEPFADPTAIPTYHLARMTREQVTVSLSGDGGDELFGGYAKYSRARRERWRAAIPRPLRRALVGLSRVLPNGARGKNRLRLLGEDAETRFREWSSRFTAADGELHSRSSLLTLEAGRQVRTALREGNGTSRRSAAVDGFLPGLFRDAGKLPALSRLLYVDLRSYLPDNCLVKVDRASMLPSLEDRVPFLDDDLVEFVSRVPVTIRMKGGEPKWLLKRAVADLLPADILSRPKRGFDLPVGEWIRGEWRGFVEDTLFSRTARGRGIFDPTQLRRLVDLHVSGARDMEYQVWVPLMFELWAREYLD